MEIKCFGFEGFTSGHYAAALPSCQATVWFFSSNVFGHYFVVGLIPDQPVCLCYLPFTWHYDGNILPAIQCGPHNASQGVISLVFQHCLSTDRGFVRHHGSCGTCRNWLHYLSRLHLLSFMQKNFVNPLLDPFRKPVLYKVYKICLCLVT